MSDAQKLQFKLMVPADLKESLEDAAHANRRSLSAEMLARLQRTIDEEKLIKAGPKEVAPDDYLGRMVEERLKFEKLLRSYQEIFQNFTPVEITRMLSTYERVREQIEKTGEIPEENPFKQGEG
jgi:hypothetical protein